MKRLSRWVPDFALGALVLALAVLLVVPWRQRRSPGSAGGEEPVSPAVAVEPAGSGGQAASPMQVAALFGWREPRAALAAQTGALAPPVEEAYWIQAIGYVVEQNAARSYIFKDTRTRTVFSLKAGSANKGWKLLEARERDFLLEFGGKPYIIKRKP